MVTILLFNKISMALCTSMFVLRFCGTLWGANSANAAMPCVPRQLRGLDADINEAEELPDKRFHTVFS
jgi:hypothetical protein